MATLFGSVAKNLRQVCSILKLQKINSIDELKAAV